MIAPPSDKADITMDKNLPIENIVGVVLAGGSARRMGGCDKTLLPLGDKPILEHVVARARPQVDKLIINTNSDPSLFYRYSLPIVSDTIRGFAGPLAGILAAMEWSNWQQKPHRWLASFPADSPFFPKDLVQRLHAAIQASGARVACAASLGQRSPLFALWSTDLQRDLNSQLQAKQRKATTFLERHRCTVVDFTGGKRERYFFNINTVEQLKQARELLDEGKNK